MAVKKRGQVNDGANSTLQAIVLADSSFDEQQNKLIPITHESPKVLLPLVNVPLIAYTLSWLQSVGVREVFVFCCNQVKDYLHMSNWLAKPNFMVSTIVSKHCVSVGDALRLMYERNVIHQDFILVNGDTVSNLLLNEALVEHKERRRKDCKSVMTMVVKNKSMPCRITNQSILGNDDLIIAVDTDTKQLLYYEDGVEVPSVVTLDKATLSDNHRSVSLYNDRQDCCIDICSPEVLAIFNDNFDYQHMSNDFIKGLLFDDAQGYKIFTYDISSGYAYAARVENLRSYDAICKDIIQRFVPDVPLLKNSKTNLPRQHMYQASEVVGQSQIGPFTVIGSGTTIGNKTTISESVVGEGCSIGSNVTIDGCYIWHNVTIEDGCQLKHAIVCDGVRLKAGAVLEPGVVLSFKVVIGEQFVVPSYSKVSLLEQPIKQDDSDDEEPNYNKDDSSGEADNNSPIADGAANKGGDLSEMELGATSQVGYNGLGFIWLPTEAEEWRYSVAPIPADKLVAIMLAANNPELPNPDDNILPPCNDSDSEVDDDDESADFEKEVEATFLRAVEEDVEEGNVILEINLLRLAYNMTQLDCAGALFYSLMRLAFDMEQNSTSELYKNVTSVMVKWHKLLRAYLKSTDEEIEIILKFEEICLDSVKQYTTLFTPILVFMYDNNIIHKEAVLMWESEKEMADESDRFFVKKAENFIQRLKEGSEEEE